jgi:glycosyltransferase A (GT-A) superfamily protein (DUF2064 family)
MPPSFIRQAFEHLLANRVVLGPADDGGYYLVGLREGPLPPIFEGIAWSSDQVWPQTLARLGEAQIKYATLPQWYDVDTYADLQRLRGELMDSSRLEPALASLRDAIESTILSA